MVTFTWLFFCIYRRLLCTCVIWCLLFLSVLVSLFTLCALVWWSMCLVCFSVRVQHRLSFLPVRAYHVGLLWGAMVLPSFLPFVLYISFMLCFPFGWLLFIVVITLLGSVKFLFRRVLPFERVVLVSRCDFWD